MQFSATNEIYPPDAGRHTIFANVRVSAARHLVREASAFRNNVPGAVQALPPFESV